MLNERKAFSFFTFPFNRVYYIPTYYLTVVLSQVLTFQKNFIFLVYINPYPANVENMVSS